MSGSSRQSEATSSKWRPTYAAKPTRTFFDPWNSSSTGHQRPENRMSGSLAWRDSRTRKLQDQFGDAEGRGGKRTTDDVVIVNAIRSGAVDAGGGLIEPRLKGQETLLEAFDRGRAKRQKKNPKGQPEHKSETRQGRNHRLEKLDGPIDGEDHLSNNDLPQASSSRNKQIFHNLTFYINGSTYPIISDHKLKRQLVEHGGRISLSLGRKAVTHVILGVRAGSSHGHDIKRPGGGVLAGGKIQKENATTKAAKFRYVNVEWVLECLARGRRVPEADFSPAVGVAGRGQRSALGIMQQGISQDAHSGS